MMMMKTFKKQKTTQSSCCKMATILYKCVINLTVLVFINCYDFTSLPSSTVVILYGNLGS